MTPDVNVLIAAFRRDHEHHSPELQWLDSARVACAEGGVDRLSERIRRGAPRHLRP